MAFWSHPAAVGLDIGSRMVKAVQLKKTGKQIELEKFGVATIYPGGEKPSEPDEQRAAISKAIGQAMRDAGITADQVVTAVAGESIIVRYIQMPEMPEAELNNALRWEAEEYIPFQIDDVNIDSAIIGRSGDEGQKKMDVLLVCARKELIKDHVALLSGAGVSASVVDVDSFAFLNCFDLNYDVAPTEAVALVNIGGDITTISVYMGGLPRFSRDISIGSNTMTAAIQQRLSLPHAEAEAVKIRRGAPRPQQSTGGGAADESSLMATIRSTVESMTGGSSDAESSEGIADRAIRSTLSNLCSEIRRSIQFFEGQSRGLTVQRLVIGGGAASFDGLPEYLHQELSLAVEIIDPLLRIPVVAGVNAEKLKECRNLLSVGIGLALRKVVD